MVIGIEGNVHVGKTTFILSNFSNYNIIGEIKFKEDLNDYDRQLYYLEQEKNKKKMLTSNTVLDRTIISTVIYSLYSSVFSLNETERLKKIIIDCIIGKQFIIPDLLYVILYPYKLICQNQKKLFKNKKTQNHLVDYNYYLNFSLFFSNRHSSYNKIINTNDYRQVLEYSKDIYENITQLKQFNSKVILDGCPAIGKTTIGLTQTKYEYIAEFKYKKYTIDDYLNQIQSIKSRIDILDKDNILIDTSFLMGITHIFYNVEIPEEKKLEVIDKIMENISLNKYVTKIIYLTLNKNEIIKRKENDTIKERKHFMDNFQYLDSEIKFYETLNNKLGNLSNIHIIDASCSVDLLIKKIYKIEDKPILLIDLFYEIKNSIITGEL